MTKSRRRLWKNEVLAGFLARLYTCVLVACSASAVGHRSTKPATPHCLVREEQCGDSPPTCSAIARARASVLRKTRVRVRFVRCFARASGRPPPFPSPPSTGNTTVATPSTGGGNGHVIRRREKKSKYILRARARQSYQ